MLEIVVVPACFLAAGVIGYRLGTPSRVAGGLVAVGCTHLLAFLGAGQALSASGATADWIHLVSQWLFMAGFVAFVWLAAAYPESKPSRALVLAGCALGIAGPSLAALSGPSPSITDDSRDLGPIVHALPAELAAVGATPLLLLPLTAVVTFVVRFRRTSADDRAAMRWPIAGLGLIATLAIAGTLLSDHQDVITALFLIGAPIFPLAVAFGPVARHLDSLSLELAEVRDRIARRARSEAPTGAVSRLSPRELTVLEFMARGMSNPVIAKSMHLSLSSVEKHATSIFRKLEIPEGPEVHRRVAAVVAYRDALDNPES